MKAADARRQPPSASKRVRPIGANYDARDDLRRHLAQRLVDASTADAGRHTRVQSLLTQLHKLTQLQSERDALQELRKWTECFVTLQHQWVDCGARLGSDALALQLWDQLDQLIRSVVALSDRSRQLSLLQQRLPKLAALATTLVQQPHQSASLARNVVAATPVEDEEIAHARIKLTYQWVPRVLRKISGSVEYEAKAGRCSRALVLATRRMLRVIRDRNPYAFFNVIYRPPPATETSATQWVLRGSPHIDGIARILRDDFDTIYELAWWMAAPDTTFWKSFKDLIVRVRHVAMAFHHVMLHLYETAMQRQNPNVTPLDVAFEIEEEIARHYSQTLQTDGYGLAKSLATADDPIIEETYSLFPEVLVYVDEWRREVTLYEHGFMPKERARDYEIGFRRWKTSKAWQDIAHHAKRMVQTWRQSQLGAGHAFNSMTFAELGKLEEDIKYRLSEITDLLYRQNLAKWSQQRYQHARARVLMELRILAPPVERDSVAMQPPTGGVASAVKSERTVSHFQPPCKTTRRLHVNAKVMDKQRRDGDTPSTTLNDEESVLKWTDDEIDEHEQETERVYELQASILSAAERLSLPSLLVGEIDSVDEEGQASKAARLFLDNEIDDLASVDGLLASCRRLRGLASRVVHDGEEIALHGAAEALIQRPSLRIVDASPLIDEEDSDSLLEELDEEPVNEMEDDVDDDSLHQSLRLNPLGSYADTLEDALLTSAERILDLQEAVDESAASDATSLKTAQKMAIEALSLLRCAYEQTA